MGVEHAIDSCHDNSGELSLPTMNRDTSALVISSILLIHAYDCMMPAASTPPTYVMMPRNLQVARKYCRSKADGNDWLRLVYFYIASGSMGNNPI